mgnify:FL=1
MNLTRSAQKALAKLDAGIFKVMLETIQRDCPTVACLDPDTITLLTSVGMRGVATAQFQKNFGLVEDGHPGQDTLAALWTLNKPTRETFEARMLVAAEDTGTVYTLGAGGYGWAQREFDDECDCSGFMAFCLGLSRKPSTAFQVKGRQYWFSTDSMVAAGKEGLFFREVGSLTPGSIVAYPDRNRDGKVTQGHTAYVSEIRNGIPFGYDCSSSQSRKTGDAIKLRSLAFFNRRKTTVWMKPTWWQE